MCLLKIKVSREEILHELENATQNSASDPGHHDPSHSQRGSNQTTYRDSTMAFLLPSTVQA